MKGLKYCLLIFFLMFLFMCNPNAEDDTNNGNENGNESGNESNNSETLIIDHTCTDMTKIPEKWIDKAKEDFKIRPQ